MAAGWNDQIFDKRKQLKSSNNNNNFENHKSVGKFCDLMKKLANIDRVRKVIEILWNSRCDVDDKFIIMEMLNAQHLCEKLFRNNNSFERSVEVNLLKIKLEQLMEKIHEVTSDAFLNSKMYQFQVDMQQIIDNLYGQEVQQFLENIQKCSTLESILNFIGNLRRLMEEIYSKGRDEIHAIINEILFNIENPQFNEIRRFLMDLKVANRGKVDMMKIFNDLKFWMNQISQSNEIQQFLTNYGIKLNLQSLIDGIFNIKGENKNQIDLTNISSDIKSLMKKFTQFCEICRILESNGIEKDISQFLNQIYNTKESQSSEIEEIVNNSNVFEVKIDNNLINKLLNSKIIRQMLNYLEMQQVEEKSNVENLQINNKIKDIQSKPMIIQVINTEDTENNELENNYEFNTEYYHEINENMNQFEINTVDNSQIKSDNSYQMIINTEDSNNNENMNQFEAKTIGNSQIETEINNFEYETDDNSQFEIKSVGSSENSFNSIQPMIIYTDNSNINEFIDNIEYETVENSQIETEINNYEYENSENSHIEYESFENSKSSSNNIQPMIVYIEYSNDSQIESQTNESSNYSNFIPLIIHHINSKEDSNSHHFAVKARPHLCNDSIKNSFQLELHELIDAIQLFYYRAIDITRADQNDMDNLIMEVQQLHKYNRAKLQSWMRNFHNFYTKFIQKYSDNDRMRVEIEQLIKKIQILSNNMDCYDVSDVNVNDTFRHVSTTENDIISSSTSTTSKYIEIATTTTTTPEEFHKITLEIENMKKFLVNFNATSFSHSDLTVLNQKTNNLIILSAAMASNENMKMEIDKLIERANSLRERTREIYLKNYTRLQQLMEIVGRRMNEKSLVYDMEVLDKHVDEINALLPRMSQDVVSEYQAFLNHYEEFKQIIVRRNAAVAILENISTVLRHEDLSNVDNDERFSEFKATLDELLMLFENTDYVKIIHLIQKQLNTTIKANYIINIATAIVNASDDDFRANLFQIYQLRAKLTQISQSIKNEIMKQHATHLINQLETRIKHFHRYQESEIMEKLAIVASSLDHPESLNFRQLKVVAENLVAIRNSVDNERVRLQIVAIMRRIHEIHEIYQNIKIKLIEIERAIHLPSSDDELNELKELLKFLQVFQKYNEITISSKARELDASLRKFIYDYQIKHEIRDVNHELIEITQTIEAGSSSSSSNSEINNNIMKLQNLEINTDDDDVQDVFEMIQSSGSSSSISRSAKSLEIIIDQLINNVIPIIIAKMSQFNESHEDMNNDTKRILMELKDTRERLIKMNLPPLNDVEMIITSRYNGTSDIINQLLRLNNLLKDSQTSALYKSTLENVRHMGRIESALDDTTFMNKSQRSSSDDDGSSEAIKNPTNMIIMNESSRRRSITTENTTAAANNDTRDADDEIDEKNTYENQKLMQGEVNNSHPENMRMT